MLIAIKQGIPIAWGTRADLEPYFGIGPDVEYRAATPCPHCEGGGWIASPPGQPEEEPWIP